MLLPFYVMHLHTYPSHHSFIFLEWIYLCAAVVYLTVISRKSKVKTVNDQI